MRIVYTRRHYDRRKTHIELDEHHSRRREELFGRAGLGTDTTRKKRSKYWKKALSGPHGIGLENLPEEISLMIYKYLIQNEATILVKGRQIMRIWHVDRPSTTNTKLFLVS